MYDGTLLFFQELRLQQKHKQSHHHLQLEDILPVVHFQELQKVPRFGLFIKCHHLHQQGYFPVPVLLFEHCIEILSQVMGSIVNMVEYESSLGSCFVYLCLCFYHSVPVRDCMIGRVTRLACAPNGNGLQPNLVMASNLRVMALLQDLKQKKKQQHSRNKCHLEQEMPGKFWTFPGNGLQPNLVMASNLRVMALLQDLKQKKKQQHSRNKCHLEQAISGKFWTMKVLRACQAVGCL